MVVCSDTNNRDILLLPFASYQGVFKPPPPWCLQLKTDAKSFFSVPLKWPVVVQCHLEEKLLEWEWLVTIGALCQAHDRTVRGLLVTLLGRRTEIWQVLPLLKVSAPRQWSQMSSCHFVPALYAGFSDVTLVKYPIQLFWSPWHGPFCNITLYCWDVSTCF